MSMEVLDEYPSDMETESDDYCTDSDPCDVGVGDCDADTECKGNYLCGLRDNDDDHYLNSIYYQPSFGLIDETDPLTDSVGVYDFCYDPDYGTGISYSVSQALEDRDSNYNINEDTAAESLCSVSDTTT
jgi:hypothetical protein